jgi:hypothetical protein
VTPTHEAVENGRTVYCYFPPEHCRILTS